MNEPTTCEVALLTISIPNASKLADQCEPEIFTNFIRDYAAAVEQAIKQRKGFISSQTTEELVCAICHADNKDYKAAAHEAAADIINKVTKDLIPAKYKQTPLKEAVIHIGISSGQAVVSKNDIPLGVLGEVVNESKLLMKSCEAGKSQVQTPAP